MPRSLAGSPRKMLPPPMTTTTCTPRSRTSWIWQAMSWTESGQIPTPLPPPRASPLSLSSMRRYLALFMNGSVLHGPQEAAKLTSPNDFSDLEADKASDLDLIAQLLGDGGGV